MSFNFYPSRCLHLVQKLKLLPLYTNKCNNYNEKLVLMVEMADIAEQPNLPCCSTVLTSSILSLRLSSHKIAHYSVSNQTSI